MYKEVAVRDLQPGDLVDLEADPYADPDVVDPGNFSPFEFELAEVVEIEVETPTCTVVGFEAYGAYGFPPTHEVRVLGHVDQETGEVTRWD